MDSVSCWPTTPGCRACPRIWLIEALEKTDFPFLRGINHKKLLGLGGGTLCPPPLLRAGIWSALNLCRSCTCCHSLSGHTCSTTAVSGRHVYLGVIHHLRLLQSFFILFYIDPKASKEGFDKDILQGPSLSVYHEPMAST